MNRRVVVGLVGVALGGLAEACHAQGPPARDPSAQYSVGLAPIPSIGDSINNTTLFSPTVPLAPSAVPSSPLGIGPDATLPRTPIPKVPVSMTPLDPIQRSVNRGFGTGLLGSMFGKAADRPPSAILRTPPRVEPAPKYETSVIPSIWTDPPKDQKPGGRPAPFAGRTPEAPRAQADPPAGSSPDPRAGRPAPFADERPRSARPKTTTANVPAYRPAEIPATPEPLPVAATPPPVAPAQVSPEVPFPAPAPVEPEPIIPAPVTPEPASPKAPEPTNPGPAPALPEPLPTVPESTPTPLPSVPEPTAPAPSPALPDPAPKAPEPVAPGPSPESPDPGLPKVPDATEPANPGPVPASTDPAPPTLPPGQATPPALEPPSAAPAVEPGPAPILEPVPAQPPPSVGPAPVEVPIGPAPAAIEARPVSLPPLPPPSLPTPSPVDPNVSRTRGQDEAAIRTKPVRTRDLPHAATRAAAVGDEIITFQELNNAVEEEIRARTGGQPVTQEELFNLRNMIAAAVLNGMIDRALVIQQARKMLKKHAKVQQMFDEIVEKEWKEKEIPILLRKTATNNVHELKVKLSTERKSYDSMKDEFRKKMMFEMFLMEEIRNKVTADMIEMKEYYNTHLDQFVQPARMTWRDIEISMAKYPTRAAARQKAEETLARLLHDEDFDAVARKVSDGPTASKGGLYVDMRPGGFGIPAVNDELNRIPTGQVSQILEAPGYFHIIRVDSRREKGPLRFDEVQDSIRGLVFQQNRQKAIEEYLARLRSKTLIRTMFDNTASDPELARRTDPAVRQAAGNR